MRALERYLIMQTIDQRWREHLYDMDYLREGIHLRGFAQIDPLVAYKNEGFSLFQDLMNTIWSDFARMIYNVEVEVEGENGQTGESLQPAEQLDRRRVVLLLGRHARRPAERLRRGLRGRGGDRRPPSSSSAASTRTSRSAATTRAGAGRARSSRSATAPERRGTSQRLVPTRRSCRSPSARGRGRRARSRRWPSSGDRPPGAHARRGRSRRRRAAARSRGRRAGAPTPTSSRAPRARRAEGEAGARGGGRDVDGGAVGGDAHQLTRVIVSCVPPLACLETTTPRAFA